MVGTSAQSTAVMSPRLGTPGWWASSTVQACLSISEYQTTSPP